MRALITGRRAYLVTVHVTYDAVISDDGAIFGRKLAPGEGVFCARDRGALGGPSYFARRRGHRPGGTRPIRHFRWWPKLATSVFD